MTSHRALRVALILAFLSLGVLQIQAIRQQSLIGDAAYHLVAGHQALRYGENTLNLEHPPLVKLLAALPLLWESGGEPPPKIDVREAIPTALALYENPEALHRVRLRSRALLFLFLGLPLLLACYGLGRHLFSPLAGTLLAATLGLSFASLPFLSVIQTDTAVALGFVSTLWMALRYVDEPNRQRALALGLGLGLALASKFTGLLLLPTAALALGLARTGSRRLRWQAAAITLLAALAVPWFVYAVANHDYDPVTGRQAIQLYTRGEALVTDDRLLPLEDRLLAIEQISPSLAQYATGLLGIRAQNDLGIYPTYAFGTLRSDGRWWYFPALLLLRTPWILLLATALAGVARLRATEPESAPLDPLHRVLVLTTLSIYAVAALSSSYNLGIRHLLPILPILCLPAMGWAARSPWRSVVLVLYLAVEGWLLAPLWMSATGTWWMGSDPARLAIVSGDTEYHQNFIALERWAADRGIDRYGVLYPLLDPRELAAYSPRAYLVTPESPLKTGWYFTSILLESHLPAIERSRAEELRGFDTLRNLAGSWTPVWEQVRQGIDHGPVAGTFRAFHLKSAELSDHPAPRDPLRDAR